MKYVPPAFEIVTYVFAVVMVWHACKTTWPGAHPDSKYRWLSTLLCGMVFGYIVECALSASPRNCYVYHDHESYFAPLLPNRLAPEKPVPLWVAMGWGILLYSTTWAGQRLKQGKPARAALAALLAVNIDLSLDPIARFFRLWTGEEGITYATYYTVPFDNFIGWFLIVFTYALLTRWLFDKLGKYRASAFWVPVTAGGIALYAVYKVDDFLQWLYPMIPGKLGDLPVFLVVFAAACVLVAFNTRRLKCDFPPSWPILAVPLVFHTLSWFVLFATGEFKTDGRATLLVGIPLALVVGFLGFGWASLDHLFPRVREPVPQP